VESDYTFRAALRCNDERSRVFTFCRTNYMGLPEVDPSATATWPGATATDQELALINGVGFANLDVESCPDW
jgi:hypothetical protein